MSATSISDFVDSLHISFDPHSRGSLLLRVIWPLIIISALVVAGRLWAKVSRTHRLYADDVLMLLALAFGITHAVFITCAVSHGLGHHLGYIGITGLHGFEQTMKWGVLSLIWAWLSPMVGRIGFCVTLLFLIGTDPRLRKWPVHTVIGVQLVINISTILVFYLQCGRNTDIFWTLAKLGQWSQVCLDPTIQTDFGYVQGALNTATDAILTVWPAILIEHSTLSAKAKTGLVFLLCLSVV